jgi:transposase
MSSTLPDAVVFGCDVSRTEIVIAQVCEPHHSHQQATPIRRIANSATAIAVWLKTLPPDAIIGMEATGREHVILADQASLSGYRVYVINPKRLASYAAGVGKRSKTDPQDAGVIARYVARERDHLFAYVAPTAQQTALRALLSQRAAIVRHATAIRLCLHDTAVSGTAGFAQAQKAALNGLDKLIAKIDMALKKAINADTALAAQRSRLQTITGIGLLNSIALTHRFDRTPFANSDAVVAAYGLDPRPRDSGKKVGRRYLTKEGNGEDRRLIYLAAQSATKTKLFKPYYQALRNKGFATTEAIIIIARKLLRIAFAVWQSKLPFDPSKVRLHAC